MARNFPNLKKETGIQEQEAQRVPNTIHPNRSIPRHIKIKGRNKTVPIHR